MGAFKIRALAFEREASFGVGATPNLFIPAGGIEFTPTTNPLDFVSIKSGLWQDKIIQQGLSGGTLSFSVPLFGLLDIGATYDDSSHPWVNYCAELVAHCMGDSETPSMLIRSPTAASTSDTETGAFTAGELEDAPNLIAVKPTAATKFQVRNMRSIASGATDIGTIAGPFLTATGAVVRHDNYGGSAPGDDLYKSSTCYLDGNSAYASSYAFNLFGDDSQDCYVLTGCCGTVSISATVGGLVMASFSFACSAWSRVDHGDASANFIGSNRNEAAIDAQSYSYFRAVSGLVSWHGYNSSGVYQASGLIDPISISLDLGITPARRVSPGADNGTANYYRSTVAPVITMTTYFSDALHDMFDSPYDSTHLYIQFGSEPGRVMCIYAPNAIMMEYPARVDVGGLTGHQISFKCGVDKLSEGSDNNQAGADLKIGWL